MARHKSRQIALFMYSRCYSKSALVSALATLAKTANAKWGSRQDVGRALFTEVISLSSSSFMAFVARALVNGVQMNGVGNAAHKTVNGA